MGDKSNWQNVFGRPILIDEADGPCEICAEWAAGKHVLDENGKFLGYRCDECKQLIKPFNPVVDPRGSHSVNHHHFHVVGVGTAGSPGRRGIVQELCLPCYVKHRQKIYPFETAEEIERKARNH